MNSRTLTAALTASILLLAACGGSSDSGGVGAGDSPFGGDDDLDVVDQILEDSGIDVENLGIDENGEVDIDEIGDAADDAIDSFATGAGTATITIDGAAYEISNGSCFDFVENLTIDGAGTTPDGEPFWGSIDYTVNDRAEMLESGLFDEAFLDQMFGDRQQAVDFSLTVEVGKADRFENTPDGKPEFTADVFMDSPVFGNVTYQRDGSSISGGGDITDGNGVAVGYSELLPFEFSASCG